MRKLIISFIAALSLVALPAHADRGYGHGDHGRSHGHGGDGAVWAGLAIFGAIAGLAILADQNRPVQVAPSYAEPVYPESSSYAVPSAPETWYYCQSSAMYYPYTKACPEGWQALPARPY